MPCNRARREHPRMNSVVLVERSCVVVANAHNPSIMNHDWLVRNHVLPEAEWEWAEPPITTLPMSRICYRNNVEVQLDSERLMVTAKQIGPPVPLDFGRVIQDVATRYVKTLPHIPYVAVGNNFRALVERADPQRWLVEQFGGKGEWTDGLQDLSVKLVHRLDGCRRSTRISAGASERVENDVAGVTGVLLVSGNYHRETNSVMSAVSALTRGPADCDDFLEFVSLLAEGSDG